MALCKEAHRVPALTYTSLKELYLPTLRSPFLPLDLALSPLFLLSPSPYVYFLSLSLSLSILLLALTLSSYTISPCPSSLAFTFAFYLLLPPSFYRSFSPVASAPLNFLLILPTPSPRYRPWPPWLFFSLQSFFLLSISSRPRP